MITSSNIAWGDQLGGQMISFANLVYVAKESEQDMCFYKELKDFRRRFLICDVFDTSSSAWSWVKFLRRFYLVPEIYCLQFKRKPKSLANWKRIYKSKILHKLDELFYFCLCRLFYRDFIRLYGKSGVHCDETLLHLDKNKNYDVRFGLGTYQDWKKYESVVKDMFVFKSDIAAAAKEIYKNIKGQKQTVAIHFRKGDYLLFSSLNLTLDYYKKALSYFDKTSYKLVIFSDDIESCKNTGLFDEYECSYMDAHPAGVDMCVMSLCDNNIIANSTFSFWGAFLNKNESKKVVCPHDFIGAKDPEHLYLNGNWYPENWMAL